MINKEEDNLLEGKITSLNNDTAIIKLKDGQEISWPKENLPGDIKIGKPVKLKLITAKNENDEQEKISKNILNKIFGNK